MYGKHFERMYKGSMMGAGADVFAVWGYAISHVQKDSVVELNPDLMAVLIGMPKDRVVKAMEFLMAPDPKSRNPEHEGRRMIRQGQYEFLLTTASYYRGIQSPEDLREYNRIKQQESRARKKEARQSAEAGSDASIPTFGEVKEYGAIHAVPFETARNFFDWHSNKNLWLNKHGRMINWKGTLMKWRDDDRSGKFTKTGGKPTQEDPAWQKKLD